MDNETILQVFYLQAACLALLIATFIGWFWLRETPAGDLTCAIVATCTAAIFFATLQVLRPFGCVGGILGIPGMIVYLWFLALWTSRRQQSRIRQWGRRHGYKVITVEPQWGATDRFGSIRDRAKIRITVRRRSDGQFLVGWVFPVGFDFDVLWDPIPTRLVGRGLHVPNPPHGTPPPPSKE
jgi:hypothetical protein